MPRTCLRPSRTRAASTTLTVVTIGASIITMRGAARDVMEATTPLSGIARCNSRSLALSSLPVHPVTLTRLWLRSRSTAQGSHAVSLRARSAACSATCRAIAISASYAAGTGIARLTVPVAIRALGEVLWTKLPCTLCLGVGVFRALPGTQGRHPYVAGVGFAVAARRARQSPARGVCEVHLVFRSVFAS